MPRPEPSMFDGMPGIVLIQGHSSAYERKGIFPLEMVLTQLHLQYAVFQGDLINMQSERYRVFARSLVCVNCGLTGTYFAKERSTRSTKIPISKRVNESWHLNMYAVLLDPWREVLMTKDHIYP